MVVSSGRISLSFGGRQDHVALGMLRQGGNNMVMGDPPKMLTCDGWINPHSDHGGHQDKLFHDGDKGLSLSWCMSCNGGHQAIMLQAGLGLMLFCGAFNKHFILVVARLNGISIVYALKLVVE